MKTMWPLIYHHNGFIAIHALGHIMYGLFAQVPQLLQRHCDDNRVFMITCTYNIYIYIYIYRPFLCHVKNVNI